MSAHLRPGATHVAVTRGTSALLALLLVILGHPTVAVAAPADDVTLAVTSINKPLYVWTPGASTWQSQGGQQADRPAVAVGGGVTHYVGIGTNGILYHRTDTTGWTRLAPDNVRCGAIAATADAMSVFVGCTGLNGALYEMSFPVEAQQPFVSTYRRLGGKIVGPAVGLPTTGGVYWLAMGGSTSRPRTVSQRSSTCTCTRAQSGSATTPIAPPRRLRHRQVQPSTWPVSTPVQAC